MNWDGKDQIVDLYTPVEGTRLVNLEPGFNLRLADTNRKIMVLFAFLAEFIILTVLILLLILLLYSPYQSCSKHPSSRLIDLQYCNPAFFVISYFLYPSTSKF